jgi:integrase
MPLKLYPPRPGKTPNFTIRGTYLGVAVNRSAGTYRRKVARGELRKIEDAIERGAYPPKVAPANAPTFLSAALAYMKAGRRRRYVGRLIAHFKDTSLDLIDQAAIDAAALALYPGVAPITRNTAVYTPVSAILHHAGIDITVKRPKGHKGKQETRFLLPPDAFAIIDAAHEIDEEMARLLTFLLNTGCRIGEVLRLRWETVSVERREVYIETSKNGDARSVRLNADALASLGHAKASGRVFRFHQGGHRNFLFLNAKVTACGLPAIPRPRPGTRMKIPPYRLSWVTFHTFCHTWATWMRRFGGADLQGLVATGRWRDPRSAARYAHVVSHEEWSRVDLLPSRGTEVELPTPEPKTKVGQ